MEYDLHMDDQLKGLRCLKSQLGHSEYLTWTLATFKAFFKGANKRHSFMAMIEVVYKCVLPILLQMMDTFLDLGILLTFYNKGWPKKRLLVTSIWLIPQLIFIILDNVGYKEEACNWFEGQGWNLNQTSCVNFTQEESNQCFDRTQAIKISLIFV